MINLTIPKDGPRIKPRLPNQVNADMQVEYEKARIRWGIPDNLIRTMGCHPKLTMTEVDYVNSIAFDTGSYVTIPKPGSEDPAETVLFPSGGFVDRITKELCISLVSLLNRSRYSITHHTMIGFGTLSTLAQGDTPKAKAEHAEALLLNLVDGQGRVAFENKQYNGNPLYSEMQLATLRLAVKLSHDERSITDEEVDQLKKLYRDYATQAIKSGPLNKQFNNKEIDAAYLDLYVDAMVVEVSWLIVHFSGLLNKWFTFTKMRDEDFAVDSTGATFMDGYNKTLPESIKKRNNELLGDDGWGTVVKSKHSQPEYA